MNNGPERFRLRIDKNIPPHATIQLHTHTGADGRTIIDQVEATESDAKLEMPILTVLTDLRDALATNKWVVNPKDIPENVRSVEDTFDEHMQMLITLRGPEEAKRMLADAIHQVSHSAYFYQSGDTNIKRARFEETVWSHFSKKFEEPKDATSE